MNRPAITHPLYTIHRLQQSVGSTSPCYITDFILITHITDEKNWHGPICVLYMYMYTLVVYNSEKFFDSVQNWLIEHGFTSAPTQYRLYGRRFLQVWWPNQLCQSTEGGWLVEDESISSIWLDSVAFH